jgi:hypothetical protein
MSSRWGTSQRVGRVALLAGISLAATLVLAAPQYGTPGNPFGQGTAEDRGNHAGSEPPFVAREMQERQLKRLREEHQKQMTDDTAALIELANDLKVQVDKSDKPNAVALKDVDEISRLAKRVSERIKTQ